MKNFILLICLSLLAPLAEGAGLPATYSGAAISGRVVDAETKQPIAGAVVVARWTIHPTRNFMNIIIVGSTGSRLLHITESVTDAGGFYHIPAWGPIVRPIGWEADGEDDPGITAFKPGYEPGGADNGIWVSAEVYNRDGYQGFNPRDAEIRRSKNDGKDIALYKYGRTPKEPTGVIDSGVKLTPEMKIKDELSSFAFSLEENVDMADDLEARGDSPKRLAAARAQLNAILITDPEIQRVYAPQKYDWGPAISDLLKEVRKGQNPEPRPVIRQVPIHEMYGPPGGKPIIKDRQ